MQKNLKIAVLGYYGYCNYGDDLMLQAVLQALSEAGYFSSINVFYTSDISTDIKDCRLNYFRRYNIKDFFRVIKESDILMLGGGSILQDSSGFCSFYYYAAVMALFLLFGRKIIVFNNGIGPLKSSLKKLITGYLLKRSFLVTVRDRESLDLINRIAGLQNHFYLGADPVFGIDIESRQEKLPGRKVIVSLRKWKKYPMEKICRELMEKLESNKYDAELVAFKKPDDNLRNEQCFEVSSDSIHEYISMMYSADYLIGMRFHSLVLAAMCNINMLAVVYDPKISAFADSFGIPCIKIEDLNSSDVITLLSSNINRKVDFNLKIKEQKELLENSWELFRQAVKS